MKMLDHPKVTVPIYDIVIDSHINTRELDEDVIEEYREAMREYGESDWQSFWNESPRMTESRHLYSGSHTVTAAMREFGREYKINVIQEGKDWREAYFLATRMNATHGRRRTNAEKELAVRRWLEDDEMCQWTDGHIAKECLVSAPFVSKVARSLETISSRPTKRKFVDSDGEIQWQETKKIGTNQPTAYNPKAQLEAEKNGCIRAQNKAYDKWHGICGEKAILFDWDQFVAVASKEISNLSLPSEDDTTPELVAEKSRQWHQLKDAISYRKAWVKSYLYDLEAKAKPRKRLLDEIMKLQIHQVSPMLPAIYTDEWRESKAGLKAAYPLYFSYSNRNNLPIETLEEMKDTLIQMKADLEGNTIAKFLSDDYKERAAAHTDLTVAWHKAQNVFNAHPLAEHIKWDDFDQEVEFYLELEEELLSPDFTGGLEAKDLRRHKHLWDKVAKALECDAKWVQRFLADVEDRVKRAEEEEKEADERIETSKHVTEAINAAKASFQEHQDALGLESMSWQQFEERATLEFKRSWGETLFQPVVSPEGQSEHSAAKLSYVGSLWVKLKKLTVPPAHDWVKIYAEERQAQKAAFHALTEMKSKVQAAYQEHLQPHKVYRDAFNEALAANIDSKLAEPTWGGMPVEELEKYTELYGRVLEAITADAEWVQALKAAAEEAKDIQQEKREASMKEVEGLYYAPNGICGLLPSVDAEKHQKREQLLKVNYPAYQTYYWRDRLNFESLEKLRDTLLQIKQDIVEKGADWFIPADPPEPEQPTALQIKPLGPSDAEPKTEVNTTSVTISKPFTELDQDCKLYVRFAIDKVRVLTEIEDLPDSIIALSKELYKELIDYAPDYSADAGGE